MKRFAAALLMTIMGAGSSWAVPQLLNFQGRIHEDGASDGPRDMTFRIFNDASGGAALFTESHTGAGGVTVAGGVFNALIGSLTAGGIPLAVFDGSDKYLEVQVGRDALPRQRITSVGYAMHSAVADQALSLGGASGSTVTVTNLTVNNFVATSAVVAGNLNVSVGADGVYTSALNNAITFTQPSGSPAPLIRTALPGQQGNFTDTGSTSLSLNAGAGGFLYLNPTSTGSVLVPGGTFSVGGSTLVIANGQVSMGGPTIVTAQPGFGPVLQVNNNQTPPGRSQIFFTNSVSQWLAGAEPVGSSPGFFRIRQNGGPNVISIDQSNNYVGIGVGLNPQFPVDLLGPARMTGNVQINGGNLLANGNISLFNPPNGFNQFQIFGANGTPQLNINVSPPPGATGTISTLGGVPLVLGAGPDAIFIRADNQNVQVGEAPPPVGINNPANKLSIAGNASVGVAFATTAAPADSLIVSGSIGIGTASPATSLTIQMGDVSTRGAGNGLIVKSPDGSKCAKIGIDNSGSLTATPTSCP